MLATSPTGFMHLNAANLWPSFTFQNVVIGADGALNLAASGTGYATAGVFMGGPFQALAGSTPWYRFTADASLATKTHLQIFSWTGTNGSPPFAPSTNTPFPGWAAAPRDAKQGVLFNDAAPNLWIGGVLRGDGGSTPALRQIRIDYGRNTYLKFLPSIYRADPASADLLNRFLSLSEVALGGLRREIVDLPRLFDATSSPYKGYPSWFSWLAGWLSWQLNQNWTEEQARDYLAEAFELYALRGTVEGLRRYLKIYAGVNALIREPAQTATVWSLGTNSSLGFTTMLASGSASGAVLDSTAVLDASAITGPDDPFGAALFDDIAYTFCIEINAGELSQPGALEAVKAVIARENPAHTVCQLCIVEPRLRVGAQGRVGIDTVVGGPREAAIGGRLGTAVLARHDRECDQKEVAHA